MEIPGLFAADISLFVMCQSAEACEALDARAIDAALRPWQDGETLQAARDTARQLDTPASYPAFGQLLNARLTSEPFQTLSHGLSYILPRDDG